MTTASLCGMSPPSSGEKQKRGTLERNRRIALIRKVDERRKAAKKEVDHG